MSEVVQNGRRGEAWGASARRPRGGVLVRTHTVMPITYLGTHEDAPGRAVDREIYTESTARKG